MGPAIGKIFIIAGFLLVIAGILLALNIHIPWLGKLPGDIHIKREGFQFYFPLTSCIFLSVVLSVILYLFRK